MGKRKIRKWKKQTGNKVAEFSMMGEWEELVDKNGKKFYLCQSQADAEWIAAFDNDDPKVLQDIIERRYANDPVEWIEWDKSNGEEK